MDCFRKVWPDKQAWSSDFDIEQWLEAGASKTADVGLRLAAILEGGDLDPSLPLLGAVLHIPTYRRDLQFYFWLAAPNADDEIQKHGKPLSPFSRTLAAWLAGCLALPFAGSRAAWHPMN